MNYSFQSLKRLVASIRVKDTPREKVKMIFDKDQEGRSITETRVVYPPPEDDVFKFLRDNHENRHKDLDNPSDPG